MSDIRTATLVELLAEIDRRRQSMSEGERCTGIAASWCPRCGSCACPRDEEGDRSHDRNDPSCPLHSPDSPHPMAPCGLCRPPGLCPLHGETP